RLDPVGAHGLVEIAVVDERSIGEVVVDDDRAALLDRLAGRSMAVGLAVLVDGGATDVGTRAEEGVADAARAAPDQVDPDALGMEEAGSLVDDVLEQLRWVPDGRDAGGDLAEGPFLGGAPPLVGS